MKNLSAKTLIAVLALVLIVAALPVWAQLTPHDVARIRNVTDVAIAPDGTRVAYTLFVPRTPLKEEDGAGWAELHVVTADGVSRPYV
ncbi:MAG: hypothetical protein ACRENW_06885, partial [Thermodesulfobacteriota bacterium]